MARTLVFKHMSILIHDFVLTAHQSDEMHAGQEIDFLQENQLLRVSTGTPISSPDLVHDGCGLLG